MSRPGNPDAPTGTGPAARPAAVSAPCPHDRRDAWVRTGSDKARPGTLRSRTGNNRNMHARSWAHDFLLIIILRVREAAREATDGYRRAGALLTGPECRDLWP